ncbi:MAG: hypothetical protein JNJ41_18545 [Bacteroidia bacterium]|nr:hypothetical protein [Bacteroidia bacterium]
MRKLIISIFIITAIHLNAQSNIQDSTKFSFKNKYLNFLFLPNDNSQARLFTCGWQYLHCPWINSFKTGGLHPSAGFNLARLFTNKHILGIYIELKGVKGFTQQNFSSEFLKDFNDNFITEYPTTKDSVQAYAVRDAFNNVTRKGFWGNYYGNIGIMFSLFPQKYGGIFVTFKKGYRGYPIFGTYGNEYISDGKAENVWFHLTSNYSADISFKPYAFFKNAYIDLENPVEKDFWKLITFSFYFEQLNLKDAEFDGKRFDSMVRADLITNMV